MYEDYEDNEIGALDCEEIEGYVPDTSHILLKYASEFQKSEKGEHLEMDAVVAKIKERFEDESEPEEQMVDMVLPEKNKWDCESILSTYSNLYNHPKLIAEPKVNTCNLVFYLFNFFRCSLI